MEDETKIPEGEAPQDPEEKTKNLWQIEKENWYDKLPLNLKQLDIIITVCWILIGIVILVIALDAMNIFNPFGY